MRKIIKNEIIQTIAIATGIHQETFYPEQEQYAERNTKFAKARADHFKASPHSNYESN